MFQTLLLLHIIAGFLALSAGLGAMLSRKGGRWHRRHGLSYVLGMSLVCATAVLLFFLSSSLFLLLVGLFSFYLVATGYRAPTVRKPGQAAQTLDWLMALGALLAGAGFVLMASGLLQPDAGPFGRETTEPVAGVFGGILLLMAIADLWRYRQPVQERLAWRYVHISRMSAGYIATTTAFLVVNGSFLPPLVSWLGPTLIGTVGIVLVISREKRRARA